jgi:hypothetical protein
MLDATKGERVMGVTQDNAFEATGSNTDHTGFFCHGAQLEIGGDMEGQLIGLRAKALNPGPAAQLVQPGIFGNSRDGPGVVGTTNANFGVYGQVGNLVPPSDIKVGVAGITNQSTRGKGDFGVYGQHGDPGEPFGGEAGVVGSSRGSPGVFGTSVTSVGVSGSSSENIGILGFSGAATGIRAISQGAEGIVGTSFAAPSAIEPVGVSGLGVFGVKGVAAQTTTGAGIVGIGNGAAYAGVFQGNLLVAGQIFAFIKDAIVPFPDGSTRLLHCMESPEHWFEDFGSARLTRGRATVKLDADFAKVVKLNGYRVFLTPEGDCEGLYVRRRGTSFEVHELRGGTSNVAFSYRIVAKRKDIKAHTRFAKIDTTTLPVPTKKPRAEAARLPSSIGPLLATLEKPTPNPPTRPRVSAGRRKTSQ